MVSVEKLVDRAVSLAILEDNLRLANNMLVNAQGQHAERANLEPDQREALMSAVSAVHEAMQLMRK